MLKMFVNPNRPRRSKSRWRKTMDRRLRPNVVLSAHRRSLFISVLCVNENYLKRAEELTIKGMTILGAAAVFPGILEAGEKIEKG